MAIVIPRTQTTEVDAQIVAPRLDANVPSGAYGASLIPGLEAVGKYFAIEQAKADQAVRTEAERKVSDWENTALFDPESGAFNKRGKDAFGLNEQLLPQYDDTVRDISKSLPKRLQPGFEQAAAQRRAEIQQQLDRHVAGEAQRYDSDETGALVESSRQAAVNNWADPKRIGLELARQHDALENFGRRNGEPQAAIDQAVLNAHSKTHVDVIDHWLADDNPAGARRYYSQVEAQLTPEARTAAASAIRVAEKRKEQEGKESQMLARQALSEQLQDIHAAATLGVPVTTIPSRAAFVTAFGPVAGDAHYKTAQQLQGLSGTIAELHTMTDQELTLEKGAIGAAKPTKVEGAQDQAFVYSTVKQASQSILNQRQQDPGGYLLENSLNVRQAADALKAGGPNAPANFLRAIDAGKESLGMSAPEVLPKSMAANIVARLTAVQPPEKTVNAIHREQATWGADWPRVYRQLAPKLSDVALVIGSGDRLTGPIPARGENTLATMAQLPTADQEKRLPAGTHMVDVEGKVQTALADLQNSIPPEGSRSYTAFENSTKLLALGYMGQGEDAGTAVEHAAKDLVNDRYSFVTFRGQVYRVPSRIDKDTIDEGATFLLGKYETPSNVVPQFGLNPSEVETGRVTDAVRNKGYWVTAPDGSGLRLYYNGEAVPGGVQYSWQELATAAGAAGDERAARQAKEAMKRAERL